MKSYTVIAPVEQHGGIWKPALVILRNHSGLQNTEYTYRYSAKGANAVRPESLARQHRPWMPATGGVARDLPAGICLSSSHTLQISLQSHQPPAASRVKLSRVNASLGSFRDQPQHNIAKMAAVSPIAQELS